MHLIWPSLFDPSSPIDAYNLNVEIRESISAENSKQMENITLRQANRNSETCTTNSTDKLRSLQDTDWPKPFNEVPDENLETKIGLFQVSPRVEDISVEEEKKCAGEPDQSEKKLDEDLAKTLNLLHISQQNEQKTLQRAGEIQNNAGESEKKLGDGLAATIDLGNVSEQNEECLIETIRDWEDNTDETESNLEEDLEDILHLFHAAELNRREQVEGSKGWKGYDSDSLNEIIFLLSLSETKAPAHDICQAVASQSDNSQSDISQPDLSELDQFPLHDSIPDVSLPEISLTEVSLSDECLRAVSLSEQQAEEENCPISQEVQQNMSSPDSLQQRVSAADISVQGISETDEEALVASGLKGMETFNASAKQVEDNRKKAPRKDGKQLPLWCRFDCLYCQEKLAKKTKGAPLIGENSSSDGSSASCASY